MYQVDGNTNVAYSKGQLQVVTNDEVQPSSDTLRKHVIEKIVKQIIKKKIIMKNGKAILKLL